MRPGATEPATLSIESNHANALGWNASADCNRVRAERFALVQFGQELAADERRRRHSDHTFTLPSVVEDHLHPSHIRSENPGEVGTRRGSAPTTLDVDGIPWNAEESHVLGEAEGTTVNEDPEPLGGVNSDDLVGLPEKTPPAGDGQDRRQPLDTLGDTREVPGWRFSYFAGTLKGSRGGWGSARVYVGDTEQDERMTPTDPIVRGNSPITVFALVIATPMASY
jgi:hypothetical protein